jgi:hypothetical protein
MSRATQAGSGRLSRPLIDEWRNMLRRMTRRTLFTATLAILGILTLAAPASASYHRQDNGSDYAGVGADHRWVEVCDMEADGNGVFGMFYGANSHFLFQVGDGNGSAGGCGNRTASENIRGFYICERQIIGNACGNMQAVND